MTRQPANGPGNWVLLSYRMPREPSTPRITIWRKLKRLGVAQLGDGLIALPVAFYMAKIARPWARRALVVAVTMPLWAGYLVKGYAWRAMLDPAGGVLHEVRPHTRQRSRFEEIADA